MQKPTKAITQSGDSGARAAIDSAMRKNLKAALAAAILCLNGQTVTEK